MGMRILKEKILDAVHAEFKAMSEAGNEMASLCILDFDGEGGACRMVGTEESLPALLLTAMKDDPDFATIVLRAVGYYVKRNLSKS